MPVDNKISELSAATSAALADVVPLVQGGTTKQAPVSVIAATPLEVIDKSAAYTFVLGDGNKTFRHPSADTTTRTWTISANASVAFPIGTTLSFINQNGAGALTIAITSDTMRLAGAGTTGSRTLAANGIATATKVDTTEWLISGVGLT